MNYPFRPAPQRWRAAYGNARAGIQRGQIEGTEWPTNLMPEKWLGNPTRESVVRLADNQKLQPRLKQSGHERSRVGGGLVGAVMETDHLLHFVRERFRTLEQQLFQGAIGKLQMELQWLKENS